MIICITGPTGVGKTDTSWALLDLASPMVFLDCDWFASRVPFSWSSESDVESVYQGISAMLSFYVVRGLRRFVVPLTVEMARAFKRHRHHLDQSGLPIFQFQLVCHDDELRMRISQRDREPGKRLAELAVVHDQVRHCAGLDSVFPAVDTTQLCDQAVAEVIWSAVGHSAFQPNIPNHI
jgi:hypothetical protein